VKEKRTIKAQRIDADLLHNIIFSFVTSMISECNIVTQKMYNLKYIHG